MITEDDIVKGFNSGFDCSAMVLSELADEIGIPIEDARRISSCFGAGMLLGSTCGAVTGALMAIGFRYGNCKPNDMATKGLVMSKKDDFIKAFTERFGTTSCMELIGYDLRIPEEYKKAGDEGVLSNVCPGFVKAAIEICRDSIL